MKQESKEENMKQEEVKKDLLYYGNILSLNTVDIDQDRATKAEFARKLCEKYGVHKATLHRQYQKFCHANSRESASGKERLNKP